MCRVRSRSFADGSAPDETQPALDRSMQAARAPSDSSTSIAFNKSGIIGFRELSCRRSIKLLAIGPPCAERVWRKQAQAESERNQFLTDFRDITDSVIRPAMQAAVDRLGKDGGGGLIEERKEDLMHRPRITLWMSLEDAITGTPRQDLNPYLQVDANVGLRRIDVWEGDMWEKEGNSRATSPWELSEVSNESVTERILDILRRAATHGVEEGATPKAVVRHLSVWTMRLPGWRRCGSPWIRMVAGTVGIPSTPIRTSCWSISTLRQCPR